MRKTKWFVRNRETGEERTIPARVDGDTVYFDETFTLEANVTYDFGEVRPPICEFDLVSGELRELPGTGLGNTTVTLPESGEIFEYKDHS